MNGSTFYNYFQLRPLVSALMRSSHKEVTKLFQKLAVRVSLTRFAVNKVHFMFTLSRPSSFLIDQSGWSFCSDVYGVCGA